MGLVCWRGRCNTGVEWKGHLLEVFDSCSVRLMCSDTYGGFGRECLCFRDVWIDRTIVVRVTS